MMKATFLALLLAVAAGNAMAAGNPEAFAQPVAGLDDAEREFFFQGRTLVRQSWIVAPSRDELFDGLGPLYNRLACISCHPRNGRGRPPETRERMLSTLVRLSIPGLDAHGGPRPHPAYGGQLNEEGIPGVPGEGRATLRWREVAVVRLPGGERVRLRRADLKFSELAYGPLTGALTSVRVGQQMVGMGLLDAVPAEAIEAMARETKPDGVRGRVNRVWDPETGRLAVGRFGYKANMPTLRAQAAGAFNGDIGITSPLFPQENCTPVQKACRDAPNGGSPELSPAQLDAVEFYLAQLALPERVGNIDDVLVRQGEATFAAIGCTACHRPQLRAAEKTRLPRLAGRTMAAYTDLLVHDMGPGLSDGRPDGLAGARDWRTAPLWGLGRTFDVSEAAFYLHDGRARTLSEAILWHGGEAKRARDRYARLPAAAREALLAFLATL